MDARLAAMYYASNVATITQHATAPNVTGSVGETSNSNVVVTQVLQQLFD